MTNRSKLRSLPIVITHMRRRAGFKSQGAAARAIQKKVGVRLNKAQISQWERGKTMPTLASLFAFLEGLGYSLQDFQDELDRAAGEEVPRVRATAPAAPNPQRSPSPTSEPETDLTQRLAVLEERLRSLEAPKTGE